MTGPENGRDLLKDTESGPVGVVPGPAPAQQSDAPNLLLKWQGLTSLFQVGLQALLSTSHFLPFSDFNAGAGRVGW